MSDKIYRIAVVTLLSLILIVMGLNTFTQFRGQRKAATLQNERKEAVESRLEDGREQNFGRNPQGRQGNQSRPPQGNRQLVQPQQINPEIQDNLHSLTAVNEQQGKLIRELFGQIAEIQEQIDNLTQQTEDINNSETDE